LEVTTVQVRKMRRTQPPGTVWVSYAAAREQAARRQPPTAVRSVDAVRLAVISRAPLKLTHGVLLADAVHAAAARKFPDDVSRHVIGYSGAATDHHHAHWVPLPNLVGPADRVQTLLVYVPNGLTADEVSRLIGVRHVSGQVGGANGDGRGYGFRDLPAADLLLQAAGPVRQVAPELCGPARRWRSLTPYLPVRHWHRNRQTLAEFLATDVNAELSYRDPSANPVLQAHPDIRRPETWARGFRRYRMKENLGKARRGLGLVLEFPEAVRGPLLLGQLSHFGYGVFAPEAE
jgi:CRISPR-associated protein Csb2